MGLAAVGLGAQLASEGGTMRALLDVLPSAVSDASALARMTSLLSWAVALAGAIVLLLPETKQLELETISGGERGKHPGRVDG
jgi:hypothetical protein